MSYLDILNPISYLYLNPELQLNSNIITVEQARDYYITTGSNLNLYSNINLPTDFNFKIYTELNKSNIAFDLPILYNTYSLIDPERLAIIHYTRNQNAGYKYSIAKDFTIEVYKTFNDVSLDYLMPSEYYIQYLQKSNLKQLDSNTNNDSNIPLLGTISDFIINLLNSKFSAGYTINSDLFVTGTIITSNVNVRDTIIASNLIIDTLTVNSTTFTETLFQDGVRLESQLTVAGSNSVFSSNVQMRNIHITDTSIFDSNVLMNSQLTVIGNTNLSNLIVKNTSDFYNNIVIHSNLNMVGSNTSLSNKVNIQDLVIDNTFQVVNLSSFSNNVYINKDLSVGNNVNILGTLQVESNITLSNNVKILKNLEVSDNVSFSNNLNIKNIVTATEYITISDKRIKYNTIDYDKNMAKEIINKLKVKEYNILDNKKKSLGLIAQELEILKKDFINNTETYNIKINKYATINNINEYSIENNKLSDNDIIKYSINDSKDIYIGEIILLKNNNFIIKDLNNKNNEKIYIHERIIKNFKSINYTEILMLCICCIQDLYTKL